MAINFFSLYFVNGNSSRLTLHRTRHLKYLTSSSTHFKFLSPEGGAGGVLPYTGYIGMCRCEGYGFQAVYSRVYKSERLGLE